jgi:bacterioferritin
MANEQLLAALNEVLAMEYGAVMQYAQHHFLVRGHDRMQFGNFFATNSQEAHLHALNLGNKIVALGGVPTIKPLPAQEATQLHEMLLQDLAMERRALAAYTKAWDLAAEHQSLRFWLEDIIRLEQLHVEELERLTDEQTAKANVTA